MRRRVEVEEEEALREAQRRAASVAEEAEDYVEVMEYVEAAEEEGSAEVEVVDAALERSGRRRVSMPCSAEQ